MNTNMTRTARETPDAGVDFRFDGPTLSGLQKVEFHLVLAVDDHVAPKGPCELCLHTEMCLTDHSD